MADFLLLIEDDPDDVYLALREIGRHNGELHVRVITHGRDALDYARQGKQVPRLILLDHRLPVAEAPQVLRALKAHKDLRAVPVLVMLSSESECERLGPTMAALGAAGCIAKPLRYSDISSYFPTTRRPVPVSPVLGGSSIYRE